MGETERIVSLCIQALTAVGTIAVAAVAIWGGWIRAHLVPPNLTLKAHNLRGRATVFSNGPPAIFYHLKVVNHRSWVPARNCRVLLKHVTKRSPSGNFMPTASSMPTPFIWAPAEITPPLVTS